MQNEIPEMIHPLGKAWDQPDKEEILLDDSHALMEQETFDALKNYELSFPTGVYEGKMWRNGGRLYWYDISPNDPNKCKTRAREIIIADSN